MQRQATKQTWQSAEQRVSDMSTTCLYVPAIGIRLRGQLPQEGEGPGGKVRPKRGIMYFLSLYFSHLLSQDITPGWSFVSEHITLNGLGMLH